MVSLFVLTQSCYPERRMLLGSNLDAEAKTLEVKSEYKNL